MNRPLIFAAAATCAAILAGTAPATSPPPLPPGLEGAALIAGVGSWLLVRALAPTGVLAPFPSGREQSAV